MEDGPPAFGKVPSDALERRLTADGSATLYSHSYDQTFHSQHGAYAEAVHVFLEGSGVAQSIRQPYEPGEDRAVARVLEVGLGTGLNLLVTAQAALAAGRTVDYVALERDLLPGRVLVSLGYERFAGEPFASLLAFRDGLPLRPPPGSYRAKIPGVKLELRLGDARTVAIEEAAYDAVYHDAFSPDANPELWSPEFLAALAGSLVPGGVLVSYTVKGEVRRQLAAAGLEVRKLPGPPGGKREMTRARRPLG